MANANFIVQNGISIGGSGGATITADPTTGAVAIAPAATVSNPNPTATVFTPTGGVTSVATTGGVANIANIATAANSASSSGSISNGSSNVTVNSGNIIFGVSGANVATFTPSTLSATYGGNLVMNGSIIPSANVAYTLGSSTRMWKDIYVGPGTLYVNGKPVISDNSGTITFSTDSNQNLSIQTAGTGDIQINPTGTGAIAMQGPIKVTAGKYFISSDGNAIGFSNQIAVDSITSKSSNTNLTLSAAGSGIIQINDNITGGGTVTFSDATASISAGTGAVVVAGGLGVGGDIRVTGNIYSQGIVGVQTNQISVTAPLLYLAEDTPYPYSFDIGMYSHFIGGAANSYQHTGFVRSQANGYWGLFSNVQSEPTSTVNWSESQLMWDKIKTGDHIIANTTVSTSTSTGALQVSGGAGIAGNVFAGNVLSTGFFYANGTPFVSSNYGNVEMRANLATSSNVSVGGWIIPTGNTTQNLGTTSNWWGTLYGVSTQAKYADLAENYQADKPYMPGTVLQFGGTHEVTVAETDTTRVAGVVSTNPAHLMNGALSGANVVALALTGRVPCMIIGPVAKGDIMVSAGHGFARANNNPAPGQAIGKAVEAFASPAKGVIEVVVGRV